MIKGFFTSVIFIILSPLSYSIVNKMKGLSMLCLKFLIYLKSKFEVINGFFKSEMFTILSPSKITCKKTIFES